MTDKKLIEALELVRGIISEGAITGFDCHNGDWAERLFKSQAVTSEALNTRQDTNSDVAASLERVKIDYPVDEGENGWNEGVEACIDQVKSLPTTKSTEWISVSERLPKHDEPIVYLKFDGHKNGVGIAYRTVSNEWNPWDFTHWIPLPTPPEAK